MPRGCQLIWSVVLLIVISNSVIAKEFDSFGKYNVALVDRFFPGASHYASNDEMSLALALYGMTDLDQDGSRDPLFHGDIVKSILSHPDINVISYALDRNMKPIESLLEQLELIRRDLFWEEDIDVILLPWESSTLISAFDYELDESNIRSYIDTLSDWAKNDASWRLTLEIIQAIEDIIGYGGEVYTIAGNGGKRMVNTYSFAEGVVTVGASEKALSHFVADNQFVDAYAPAAYVPERIDNNRGEPLGYDVDGDACIDIDLALLSPTEALPKTYWKPIMGSSFAAPAALKQDLLGYSSALECE